MTPTFPYLAIDYYVDLYYKIVYGHALNYCWWPMCTVSRCRHVETYSTIQYQNITLWYDCADVVMQVKSMAGYILCIYTIYLFSTLLCIYLFYIQYFEIVPPTPDFMSDPRFVSFIVYVDNSWVLSTSSPESGVEEIYSRSRSWSTEPTCSCVYISVVYFYHMTSCIFIMRCIWRYYSVPIMYWLYITCFRSW